MVDNFSEVIQEISNRLENLKRSGQIDSQAMSWGIDKNGLTIEVVVIRKGTERKVKAVYGRECENIVKDLITKVIR
jgi:hypothetical protein